MHAIDDHVVVTLQGVRELWVERLSKNRALVLIASGRTIVGDLMIGEVLAQVPPDTDGVWPAEPVRDLV
jgi:hypothetical protein